jgi:hypothetical protein
MDIPESEFTAIVDELKRQPLQTNAYRKRAGRGQSQAFGVINRRCLPPDYSRCCWKRPYLYKLLLDFGEKWVKIPFNAITINNNYAAAAHRDKGNVGESFLVGCGDYEGGVLKILEGDQKGDYNIRHRGIVGDFGKNLHEVTSFTGHRISLVYYTAAKTPLGLPPPSVKKEKEGETEKWVFYRGDERISSRGGLPHPLKGRKIKREP